MVPLLQGMIFIHESLLHSHGNLKSSNCVVNSRWTLQVADYGLPELREPKHDAENQHAYFQSMECGILYRR